MTTSSYDARETARLLTYPELVAQVREVLLDPSVQVPERMVQPLPGGGSLLAMPALDSRLAITKLITYTPANVGTRRPTIQGDVIVFDVASGERRAILDGPTVTGKRTAAVSLLAAQLLAPNKQGPLLIVGAGAQGKAHLEAFARGLPIREVLIASKSTRSANTLAEHARSLGLQGRAVSDPDAVLADCPLVVTCTPADGVVLSGTPRNDAFIAAVGAFTPQMVEVGPGLCRLCAERGTVVIDTRDALHEAGDLIQAGLDVASFYTLGDIVNGKAGSTRGPVLFKSCGWAGWDLAAARVVVR